MVAVRIVGRTLVFEVRIMGIAPEELDCQALVIPKVDEPSSPAFMLFVKSHSQAGERWDTVNITLLAPTDDPVRMQTLDDFTVDDEWHELDSIGELSVLKTTGDGYEGTVCTSQCFSAGHEFFDLGSDPVNSTSFAVRGLLATMVLASDDLSGTKFVEDNCFLGVEMVFWSPGRKHSSAILVVLPKYEDPEYDGGMKEPTGRPIITHLPWFPWQASWTPPYLDGDK